MELGRGSWRTGPGVDEGRVNGAGLSGTKRPHVGALVVARPVDDLWRHPVRSADDSAMDVEPLLQGRYAEVGEFDPTYRNASA